MADRSFGAALYPLRIFDGHEHVARHSRISCLFARSAKWQETCMCHAVMTLAQQNVLSILEYTIRFNKLVLLVLNISNKSPDLG